jgi:hypothetical protein
MYQLAWTKPAISDFQRKQRRNISDPSHNTTRWVDSCQLIILAVSHPHSAIFPYGRLTGRRPPKRACEADVYRSCRRANVGILVTVTVSSPVFPWTDANRTVSDFFYFDFYIYRYIVLKPNEKISPYRALFCRHEKIYNRKKTVLCF